MSASTVSKVLNGQSGISAETRRRVEDVLQRHGYIRRGAERSAAVIELVFSELDSAWSMEIIRGVEAVAREHELSVVLTESGTLHRPGPEWINGVLRRKPIGVILMFSDLPDADKARLRLRHIPMVIVDPAGSPPTDVPTIGAANWDGGVLAAQHLIDLGHRRIATITGPSDMLCSQARLSGYRSALEAAGIPVRPDWIRPGRFHVEDGRSQGYELLRDPDDRPTAIFGGSDLQSIGVYEAARSLGLTVPGDVSVVGFDDIPLAAWAGPSLTTVRQPLTEMAMEAARLVLKMAAGGEPDHLRIDLATSLVVRDSTRPIAPDA